MIEEKIIRNQVVVRAAMTSFSSEVVVDAEGKYRAVLKFNVNVSEYLKGTGPSSIVAVWVDGWPYDTREEAEAKKTTILAGRDSQWDDRDAVIFLFSVNGSFGTPLDTQLQLADHFLLSLGHRDFFDDRYSLHSQSDKEWLPAATSTSSTGDSQEFLLDVPPPTETITLGDLKARITEVTAELDGGDGSEEYRECVLEKYRHIRNQRNFPEERGRLFTVWNIVHSVVSGLPAGTVLDQRESGSDEYPDASRTITLWLEGRDSALFDTAEGDTTVSDTDGDGEYDTIKYDEIVNLARPIPAGEYRFDLKEAWPFYALCNYVISNEWTVTAIAPGGTLHEAFFDPVTDATAVAADDSNGVLKPASFTDSNGASATIERIAWEAPSTGSGQAGRVKLRVSPHDGIAGHVVDFIELDGTVSLSLNADEATADAANDTLSWAVASQPWEDGDTLMLRIREVRDAGSNGTVVPNPEENSALVSDCVTLLTARDVLRGTAPLNWSVERRITSWDGVTVEDAPKRVTILDLNSRDPTMDRLDAVMDMSFEIQDEDIAQLQAIYLLHNSH